MMAETDDDPTNGGPADDPPPLQQSDESMASDVRTLKAERDKFLDLARRTQAEFENYQKRVRRDWETDRRYSAQPIVTDLLPVIDNLERALSSAKGDEATGPLHQGIEIVHKQWLDALARHGVVPMAPVGEPFDPNLHEALMQQPSPEVPPMTVLSVTRNGYMLHDRVLRPAQVIVAAAP